MTRRQRTQLDHLLTLHIVQRVLTLIMVAILLATLYLIVTRLEAAAAVTIVIPILKMVHPDMTSDVDRTFVYPCSGPVVDRGGNGLHGYAYGIGERGYVAELMPYGMTWLVLIANNGDVIATNQRGKARFTRATVVGSYPDDLTGAVRHIARLTDTWTTPAAAAELARYRYDDPYFWAVHRVLSPSALYLRTLPPVIATDAWSALVQPSAPPVAPPVAAPPVDDSAHRAAQLALAARIQRQRKAARQRLREQHRAIAVDWFVPVPAPRGNHG